MVAVGVGGDLIANYIPRFQLNLFHFLLHIIDGGNAFFVPIFLLLIWAPQFIIRSIPRSRVHTALHLLVVLQPAKFSFGA